jgi:hypothetical protein
MAIRALVCYCGYYLFFFGGGDVGRIGKVPNQYKTVDEECGEKKKGEDIQEISEVYNKNI